MTDRRPPARGWLVPVAALVVGLVVTGVLAWLSAMQYSDAEKRLLVLRARDVGSVLTTEVPDIETTLGSAAALADATGGDVRQFRRLVSSSVGVGGKHLFVSVSLWRLADPGRGPLAVVGAMPKLGAGAPARAFFARAGRTRSLSVIGLLSGPDPRIGYELGTATRSRGFAVYGESALPTHRHAPIARSSPFAGLDYAIYLGRRPRPAKLLGSSRSHLPLHGRTATVHVPFGDTALTLVVASRESLSGTLPRDLPWIIAGVGALLSVVGAAGARRLTERRRLAELLAADLAVSAEENRRLYAEQRNIAQTLQRALLPEQLPEIAGVRASATYRPGERGVDVGGDWYDVVDLGSGRLLVVIGDVSGHGLRAATTMAELRHAIRAYAHDDPPDRILNKVSRLLDVVTSGQMATILCAHVEPARGRLTFANAGHLPPLLIDGGDGRYLQGPVGVPIGVRSDRPYTAQTVALPASAILLAFTDGLVERRGESIDDGLTRLARLAAERRGPIEDLVDWLAAHPSAGPAQDDIAIVGVSWSAA